MNEERASLISWIRGEIVGPSRPVRNPVSVVFESGVLVNHEDPVNGPMVWEPDRDSGGQEVLNRRGDAPYQKYGAGLLHPDGLVRLDQDDADAIAGHGNELIPEEYRADPVWNGDGLDEPSGKESPDFNVDDFEVSSTDVRYPSTMGITFSASIEQNGELLIHLPREKRFFWQSDNDEPFPVNGRYEQCTRQSSDGEERPPLWRRYPCFSPSMVIRISAEELQHRMPISKPIRLPEGSPENMSMVLKVYPRQFENALLLTVILQNTSADGTRQEHHAATLYQSFFEITLNGGTFVPYPETHRDFKEMDEDEQSLALLYRDSSTWAIGHGCAAGWDAAPCEIPESVYADVMPAVELPSMTPDIVDGEGNPIRLSMRQLSSFAPEFDQEAAIIRQLADEYSGWIERQRVESEQLPNKNLQAVAERHLNQAQICLDRIRKGIALLKENENARNAFRLANLSMLLQQIAGKQLKSRPLVYNNPQRVVVPDGVMQSPWQIYHDNREDEYIGHWRAFQLAFFLMSIEGVMDGHSPDRETVDLIWFPTGGGKTEAYLAVVSFYLFYQRLEMGNGGNENLIPDGTNVLMRYTLRMLTSQQFQRAASLITAMEHLRRLQGADNVPVIPGVRFSIGLWVGRDATPNTIEAANTKLNHFRNQQNGVTANPFILTECPWCRAAIGRYEGQARQLGNDRRVKGIENIQGEGPLLRCSDPSCEFGGLTADTWLPVEVVDERIYRTRPSLVIGTVDKFAMIAWKPEAGALFGKTRENGQIAQSHYPPGLIIQDELHLISGPLGTMYAMYESIFEKLCTVEFDGTPVKPKIISSTATIRGAADQVKAVYARESLSLFPGPGLTMGDSFFGAYARDERGKLRNGRLYLGIHANEFGILTTEARVFASALFRSFFLAPENRDPWWTLLVFFNSIRELGGARSLFDSDIRDRIKFLFNRIGQGHNTQERRYLNNLEELTGRIDNAAIVGMMDKLSKPYQVGDRAVVDACLASNVIEVGVDIDRLSLMGVVGQPKTTSQYIQVTGRVGRKWESRPGLILMLYNPSKSRDRSHYEHFSSYHNRLYEQVEPTSATPFSGAAITRALPGMLISWVRQQVFAERPGHFETFSTSLEEAYEFILKRCCFLLEDNPEELDRAIEKLGLSKRELVDKWRANPQHWQSGYQQDPDLEYLMLWPGEYRTGLQERKGVDVPSSMRSVDAAAGLDFSSAYFDARRNH